MGRAVASHGPHRHPLSESPAAQQRERVGPSVCLPPSTLSPCRTPPLLLTAQPGQQAQGALVQPLSLWVTPPAAWSTCADAAAALLLRRHQQCQRHSVAAGALSHSAWPGTSSSSASTSSVDAQSQCDPGGGKAARRPPLARLAPPAAEHDAGRPQAGGVPGPHHAPPIHAAAGAAAEEPRVHRCECVRQGGSLLAAAREGSG